MCKQQFGSQSSQVKITMVTLLSEKKFKVFRKFRKGYGLY
jgi:hypothetical protein